MNCLGTEWACLYTLWERVTAVKWIQITVLYTQRSYKSMPQLRTGLQLLTREIISTWSLLSFKEHLYNIKCQIDMYNVKGSSGLDLPIPGLHFLLFPLEKAGSKNKQTAETICFIYIWKRLHSNNFRAIILLLGNLLLSGWVVGLITCFATFCLSCTLEFIPGRNWIFPKIFSITLKKIDLPQ